MRHSFTIFLGLALLAPLLTACGGTSTSATLTAAPPAASATPNPCAPGNIQGAVGAVNGFMREFDDESELASNVPHSQLALHIAALQSIRRRAQDQTVPACLVQLKQLQLAAMNPVIDTLMIFLGGGDQQGVTGGIAIARRQHDLYLLEMARVLGLTAVVVTRAPAGTSTTGSGGTSAGTQAATAPVSQGTASASSGLVAVNPAPTAVNLRAAPDASAKVLGTLEAGKSAVALGITPDGTWIQVELPGHPEQTAWVSATEVQVTYPNP